MDEKHNQPCPDQDFYQTGSTQPPKSHSGIITLLLSLVILLAGLVSLLGVQNIRLFQALKESELSALSDAQSPNSSTQTTGNHVSGQPSLGIQGEEVTAVSQHYYGLPAGVYITQVSDGAQTQGMHTGDILLDVNGTRVSTPRELSLAVSACRIGETATVTVYRNKERLSLTLTVEAAG